MAHLLKEQLERIAPLLSNPEYYLMAQEGDLDPTSFDDPQLYGRHQEELRLGFAHSDMFEQSMPEPTLDPKVLDSFMRTAKRMLKDGKTVGLVYAQLERMGCEEDMCSHIVLSVLEYNMENK